MNPNIYLQYVYVKLPKRPPAVACSAFHRAHLEWNYQTIAWYNRSSSNCSSYCKPAIPTMDRSHNYSCSRLSSVLPPSLSALLNRSIEQIWQKLLPLFFIRSLASLPSLVIRWFQVGFSISSATRTDRMDSWQRLVTQQPQYSSTNRYSGALFSQFKKENV